MINPLPILTIISCILLAQQEPHYTRYFLSETSYRQNLIQEKPESGIPFIKVIYNDHQLPIVKIRFNMNHDIWEKEIHTYTNQNELESTFTYTGDDTPRELRIFGDNEPWSQAFRDYVFKKNTSQSFHGQTTQFLFSVDGTLTTIKLINPMGFPYGEIKFFYDYLGFVKEETWQSLPSGNVIRRFVYEMDIQNESKKLWEYGKKGEEISYIELQMGDDDKLYPNPIPRTGNILDEVDIVLNEIIRTGIHPPIPAHIPQMETDQVLLKNGDLLDVKIISIHDNHVSFKMENDTLNYSIQLNKVVQVKDRWGHILFPKYP